MRNFADRLTAATDAKKSCVVVGLDPRADALPDELRDRARRSRADAAEAILEFNRRALDAVAPYAVAVKPQVAFYEALGWEGYRAFGETIRAAKERDLLVITDAKRGDIGATAEAYAAGHLDLLDADSLTVNPYLGVDGLAPFIKRTADGKGLFVLVKTSNPSSVELQDLKVGEDMLYERVARLVESWGAGSRGECGYSAVGAVVGATFPEAAAKLRQVMPHAIFLVPGYGAQGAGARDCAACFDRNGYGAVVNSSRGITQAFGAKDAAGAWEAAIANAARAMRDELERVRTARSRASRDASTGR